MSFLIESKIHEGRDFFFFSVSFFIPSIWNTIRHIETLNNYCEHINKWIRISHPILSPIISFVRWNSYFCCPQTLVSCCKPVPKEHKDSNVFYLNMPGNQTPNTEAFLNVIQDSKSVTIKEKLTYPQPVWNLFYGKRANH